MKLKAGLGILVLMMISVVSAHAQLNLPCGGEDPDATCPLDTWVIILVLASGIFTAYRLYRRQTASLSRAAVHNKH